MVFFEDKYLRDLQRYLKNLAHISFESLNYNQLLLIQKQLNEHKIKLGKDYFFEKGKRIQFQALAPTPLALASINTFEKLISKVIEKKLELFKEYSDEFEKFKITFFSPNFECINWSVRKEELNKTIDKYRKIFDLYKNYKRADTNISYIENTLFFCLKNEEKFTKEYVDEINRCKKIEFSIDDLVKIEAEIKIISNKKKYLSNIPLSLKETLPLLFTIEKEFNNINEYLKLLEGILDKSYFRPLEEYCKSPIKSWDHIKINRLSKKQLGSNSVPEAFESIISTNCNRLTSIKETYDVVLESLLEYKQHLNEDFGSYYKENFLKKTEEELPLTFNGYDIDDLYNLLNEIKIEEKKLKEDFVRIRYIDVSEEINKYISLLNSDFKNNYKKFFLVNLEKHEFEIAQKINYQFDDFHSLFKETEEKEREFKEAYILQFNDTSIANWRKTLIRNINYPLFFCCFLIFPITDLFKKNQNIWYSIFFIIFTLIMYIITFKDLSHNKINKVIKDFLIIIEFVGYLMLFKTINTFTISFIFIMIFLGLKKLFTYKINKKRYKFDRLDQAIFERDYY